jgi:hypothetical protein
MRHHFPLLTACLAALASQGSAAAPPQYLFIHANQAIPAATLATVSERPQPVTFRADDCGITAMLDGGPDYPGAGISSAHFSATAYRGQLLLDGAGQPAAYMMARPLRQGQQLFNFKLLENGQPCSEQIDGKTVMFRMYSAEQRG